MPLHIWNLDVGLCNHLDDGHCWKRKIQPHGLQLHMWFLPLRLRVPLLLDSNNLRNDHSAIQDRLYPCPFHNANRHSDMYFLHLYSSKLPIRALLPSKGDNQNGYVVQALRRRCQETKPYRSYGRGKSCGFRGR